MSEPKVSRRSGDPRNCEHGTIAVYRYDDPGSSHTFGRVALWACDECGLRFDPRVIAAARDAHVEPGLDVERLRLAMRDVPDEDIGPDGETGWMRGRTPEEVAFEYNHLTQLARLSSTGEEP